MKVRIESGYYYFKIFINDTLHVCIDRKEFVGINSWTDSPEQSVIEYITKTNCIRTEFDNAEKWEAVLKELNNSL